MGDASDRAVMVEGRGERGQPDILNALIENQASTVDPEDPLKSVVDAKKAAAVPQI